MTHKQALFESATRYGQVASGCTASAPQQSTIGIGERTPSSITVS